MFKLFDLVETSARVFASIIDKPDEPIMYPKPDFGKGNTGRNPFCEEKLIHVNFVKINQESLRSINTCPDIVNKNSNGLSNDDSDKIKEKTNQR